MSDLLGTEEIMPAHAETDMGANDVYFTHWQGGGGFGDPLLREPARVAHDVRKHRVSEQAASNVYGVVLDDNGDADITATEPHRIRLRRERAGIARHDDLAGTSR